jgi:hypothetical protein
VEVVLEVIPEDLRVLQGVRRLLGRFVPLRVVLGSSAVMVKME